jgi:hypothetical protein
LLQSPELPTVDQQVFTQGNGVIHLLTHSFIHSER